LRELVEVGSPVARRLRPFALPVRHELECTDATRFDFQVEIFGEPLDETEALGERRSALESDVESLGVQRPKGVRNPVVLLDKADREPAPTGNDAQKVVEFRILVNKRHAADAWIAESISARVTLVA
jgi:hypothetical protein